MKKEKWVFLIMCANIMFYSRNKSMDTQQNKVHRLDYRYGHRCMNRGMTYHGCRYMCHVRYIFYIRFYDCSL